MPKKSENYLDYIPVISDRHTWDKGEDGRVTIHMVHRGFFAWIAHKIFHRPHISHIALDEMGSFIYQRIDGKNTVEAIAGMVEEEFGEKAEPLYNRLVKYMQILKNNDFIDYAERD